MVRRVYGELSRCCPVHVRDRGGKLWPQFQREGVEFVRDTVVMKCINICRFSYFPQFSEGGSVIHRTNHSLSWDRRSRASRLGHVDHRLVGILYRYIEWSNVSWVIVEGRMWVKSTTYSLSVTRLRMV